MRGLMTRIVTIYLASKLRRIPLKLAGAALFILVICDSGNSQLSNPCTGTIKDFPEGEFHMARVIYPTVGVVVLTDAVSHGGRLITRWLKDTSCLRCGA